MFPTRQMSPALAYTDFVNVVRVTLHSACRTVICAGDSVRSVPVTPNTAQ